MYYYVYVNVGTAADVTLFVQNESICDFSTTSH